MLGLVTARWTKQAEQPEEPSVACAVGSESLGNAVPRSHDPRRRRGNRVGALADLRHARRDSDERFPQSLLIVGLTIEAAANHTAFVFIEGDRQDVRQAPLIGRRIEQVDMSVVIDITALTDVADPVCRRPE